MRGEILGVERRRRWDDAGKLAIVSAVCVGGASVTQVAQRHEVTRQQIYAWRSELKRKGLWSPDAGALFAGRRDACPRCQSLRPHHRFPGSSFVWPRAHAAVRERHRRQGSHTADPRVDGA
ncbi:transposase [Roseicitreum antarcticum]|uniref:transposase n=1 Tax=Roseicitreum antarcticum TaxID=564137 RepID=UPI0016808CC9